MLARIIALMFGKTRAVQNVTLVLTANAKNTTNGGDITYAVPNDASVLVDDYITVQSISRNGNSGSPQTISDSGGGAWTTVDSIAPAAGGYCRLHAKRVSSATLGSTITITGLGGAGIAIITIWRNVDAALPIGSRRTVGSTAATAGTIGSVTAQYGTTGMMVIAMMTRDAATNGGATAATWGAFTEPASGDATVTVNAGGSAAASVGYKQNPGNTATGTFTWTWSTSASYAAIVYELKAQTV